jgi:hypothetical protein
MQDQALPEVLAAVDRGLLPAPSAKVSAEPWVKPKG